VAKIVLGMGTSHSPLLALKANLWKERAADDQRNETLTLSDGRTLNYGELLAERGAAYAEQVDENYLRRQAERSQADLDRLAQTLREVAPDVLLVVGDDQEEMYKAGNLPALSVYYGDEVIMRPLGEILPDPAPWMRQALSACGMDTENRFRGAPQFALQLIERLMDLGVDLGVASAISDPRVAAFGHAYGFVVKRLIQDRSIPIVPLLLNTYYPPNVIRPRRCFEIGRMIARAIEQMPDETRVAVIASGGLSHFVTDEALDQHVLNALRERDSEKLASLPMKALRAGSSEILCWVLAGGVFHDLNHVWSDYVPVYRTPAGTGIGLAFGIWA
jgi:hypothetical protein